jgi:hypothetical protein
MSRLVDGLIKEGYCTRMIRHHRVYVDLDLRKRVVDRINVVMQHT